MNTPRGLGRMPARPVSEFSRDYQGNLGSRLDYEGGDISAADRQPTKCRAGFTCGTAGGLDCAAPDYQHLLHQTEGAAPSEDHGNRVPHRPNMPQESILAVPRSSTLIHGGFESEPVSPTSRQILGQTEVDNDATSEEEEEEEDEMLIPADEQDYDRESVNDGAPRTADEIRAEKRKMKRFRY
ncbi:hypothetical protein MMC30_000495 [Trapelia coarctata]|nr:hypothetical protein [Trapelia coarctata]